jgi:hypothetical protein
LINISSGGGRTPIFDSHPEVTQPRDVTSDLGGGHMTSNHSGHNGFSAEETISLIESNTRFWYDAAQYCKDLAQELRDEKRRRELELVAAVYRERADLNAEAIKKMRGENKLTDSSESFR